MNAGPPAPALEITALLPHFEEPLDDLGPQ